MKLKRLEITGFKSFVERTLLDFDDGITSIVGPNGCGKSNVVDAIRWVMGEQSARNLRGKSMEDVIFGGSENRKPLGMAEVSLIMDNAEGSAPAAFKDYAEIQVCRRLYRNGDSEYLLNNTPCRLLDITELFMDTGVGTRAYSIIEQGKIGMIVNAKPEERRTLIEEAAGVTKFKARKKSALRKIDATRQNLLRLTDIISEVRRQMNSLKRQAQRAQRFREFREELKGIELQFALRQFRELSEQVDAASRSTKEQTNQVEVIARQVEQAELNLEQARLEHIEKEKETTNSQEQVFALTSEAQKLESTLEFGVREVENLDRSQERIAEELADIERRLNVADEEEKELRESLRNQLQLNAVELEKLTSEEETLADLTSQEEALNHQLEQARTDLYHLLSDLSRLNSQQEEAERRLKALAELTGRNHQEAVSVREQFDKLQLDGHSLSSNLSVIENARNDLISQRSTYTDRQAGLRQDFEQLEVEMLRNREKLSRQKSRLESLQQLERDLEGYGRGVKTLLSDENHKSKMHGLVADILDVPPRYEAAVEAVLGERVQALVPASAENISAALDFLREKEGRCTFLLPNTEIDKAPYLETGTPLFELIEPQKQYSHLIERLLRGVYLVDALDPFLSQRLPFGITLVTEEGGLLNYRGEMTGGGRQTLDQGFLHKKREIKDLTGQVRQLDKVVTDLETRRDQLRNDIQATETGLREIENQLMQQEIRVVDSQKDLAGLRQEEARLQDRLEILSLEEEQLHEEHQSLVNLLQESSTGRTAGETKKVEQEQLVARLQQENVRLRQAANEIRQNVTTLKVTLASLREREEATRSSLARLAELRTELCNRQASLSKQRVDAAHRQEALRGEAKQLKRDLEDLFQRRVTVQSELDSLRDRFEASREEIENRENELKQLRWQANQGREDLATKQMQNRELVLETEHLRQNFMERYRVDLAVAATEASYDENFDFSSGQQRRDYLQKRIDDIGEVNLMASEEFQDVEERYSFLTTQQDDLQQSLDGLQAAITKINRTTRKRFREAFDLVNTQFKEVFPRLFNGGQAELRLTDENDLLETGIEIVAQPPGKKLQNVTLLSGGEKALTAVSLIFSIFLVKPSPFCLLDEVDAPLDDANIGRFNDMVSSMADSSQFIIITHNKRTMEIADNLYGITMEEPGISKLVSVRMKEVA